MLHWHMIGVDVLDVTKEGAVEVGGCETELRVRIDRVESQITEKH